MRNENRCKMKRKKGQKEKLEAHLNDFFAAHSNPPFCLLFMIWINWFDVLIWNLLNVPLWVLGVIKSRWRGPVQNDFLLLLPLIFIPIKMPCSSPPNFKPLLCRYFRPFTVPRIYQLKIFKSKQSFYNLTQSFSM